MSPRTVTTQHKTVEGQLSGLVVSTLGPDCFCDLNCCSMFPNPQYRMPGSNPNPLGTRAMAGPTVGVVIGVQRHIELYTSKIPSLARSSTGMEVVKLFSMMSVLTQRHNYARGVGVGVGGYTFSTVNTLHSQKPLAIQNHCPPPSPRPPPPPPPHFPHHFHSSCLSFFLSFFPPPPPKVFSLN